MGDRFKLHHKQFMQITLAIGNISCNIYLRRAWHLKNMRGAI